MRTKTKADEIDTIIISALLKDARTSFTDLAKICKISINAVSMRFNRLKKAGIINGQVIEVNPESFGYNCIAELGIDTTIDDEQTIMEKLKKTKGVLEAGKISRYNVMALLAFQSTSELTEAIQQISADPRIKHTETFIWPSGANMIYPENLCIHPFKCNPEQTIPEKLPKEKFEEFNIDEIDRRIIRIMAKNSRMPFKKIAENLGVSTNMIVRKYERLRQKNVITRCAITVDLRRLGYEAFASVLVKTTKKSEITKVYSKMVRIPNLIDAIKFVGIYDVRAIVAIENIEDVFLLTDRIGRIEHIDKAEISLHKLIHYWPFNSFTLLA